MKSVVTFAFGFASGAVAGWVSRNLSDTPQGAAVKILETASDVKDRIVRWTAIERERFEDMMAAARAEAGHDSPPAGPSRTEKDTEKENGAASRNGKGKKDKDGTKATDEDERSHHDKEEKDHRLEKERSGE
jgi:hypothetical protein